MEQFSPNIYTLINKNNIVVCVYDQHNIFIIIMDIYYKSIQSYQYYSHMQYNVLSHTVVRVVVSEYKCMHVVFEFKCMHFNINEQEFFWSHA